MGMMINRRRVCGGKNLPYDYEVEYIRFDGVSTDVGPRLRFYNLPADGYMDVDITATSIDNQYGDFGVAISFEVHGVTKDWEAYRTMLYTTRKYYGQTRKGIQFETGKGIRQLAINTPDPQMPYNVRLSNLRYHVKPNDDNSFKWCDIGNASNTMCMIFRSMKLYDLNNNLVFDAVPVSVNGIGQLYDRVSGKFGDNIGTADFTTGPRVI